MSKTEWDGLVVACVARLREIEHTPHAESVHATAKTGARVHAGCATHRVSTTGEAARGVKVADLLAIGRAFRRAGARNLADERVLA